MLVCNARYVPIAGHRALRPATKFMEENKDMSVWLAPVEGQRVLVPLRIAVRTMIGHERHRGLALVAGRRRQGHADLDRPDQAGPSDPGR